MNHKTQPEYRVYQGVLQQDMQALQDFWDLQTSKTFRPEIIVRAFDGGSDEIFLFVADRCTDEEISRNIGHTLHHLQRFLHILPRADLTYDHSKALSWSIQIGNFSMVERILPLSDLQDPECDALYTALFEGHHDVVDLLFPVSNIEATIDQLVSSEYDCEREIQWLQEKINKAQNDTLQKEIAGKGIHRNRKI